MSKLELTEEQRKKVTEWLEGICHTLAKRLVDRRILGNGVRVESRWVWPGKIMIGVAFETADPENSKIWVIGGDAMTADVVPLDVARNPRDVAKHLALNWQVKGARLGKAADSTEGEKGTIDYKGLEETLREQAEVLYQLAEDESMWPDMKDEPGAGKQLEDKNQADPSA